MAPGVGPLPAAEADVPVAEPVARYLRSLPPRGLARVRLALRVFDRLPFPWRFSRASLEARQGYLRELEHTRFSPFADLLLLMKVLAGMGYGRDPAVQAALGYGMRCEVAPGEPAPSEPVDEPLGDLDPPVGGEDCDVAIIGSGAGGAVAATVLAEAGLDVVVLEAGPYLDRRDYPDDPLDALTSLYRDGGLTVAEGRPAIPVPIGRAVGGTTVINSGTCFRAPEHVLREWRDQRGVEWATELEADYAEAEELLRVTPVDVERMGRNGQLVMEGASELGASGGPIRRNAGHCIACSSCPAGCRLDAKQAMHVSYLPRAVAAGARVRAGVEARGITFENGRATGVSATVSPDGRPPRAYELRARRAVICAAGAVGTPELLLRSGVRDSGGRIGRDLRIHPACWIGARFDEEVRGWDGVMQSYYVDEWKDMGLLLEATFTPLAFGAQWLPGTGVEHQERVIAYDRLGSNGVHLHDESAGRVGLTSRGDVRVTYRLTRGDAEKLVFGVARAAEIFFAAGAREVYSQVRGMPVIKPGGVADFESASPSRSALRLEAFHPMGTAGMSTDPAAGATAPDGAVHGTTGLYVADASLFPTSLGVNPMMTVIACASRISRGLAERMAA